MPRIQLEVAPNAGENLLITDECDGSVSFSERSKTLDAAIVNFLLPQPTRKIQFVNQSCLTCDTN